MMPIEGIACLIQPAMSGLVYYLSRERVDQRLDERRPANLCPYQRLAAADKCNFENWCRRRDSTVPVLPHIVPYQLIR